MNADRHSVGRTAHKPQHRGNGLDRSEQQQVELKGKVSSASPKQFFTLKYKFKARREVDVLSEGLTAPLMAETLDMEFMLEKVRHYILNSMDTRDNMLREMALYFATNQGKMLRPTLTLACGLIENMGRIDIGELYRAAAGVEILHMSALVHDDILDRANIRRGQPSINALYGKDNALLLGDYFYSRALHIMSDLSHICILRKALKVIARMVEGEIKQQQQAFDFSTDIKDYIVMITYKTASLTSLSCFAGARTANLPDEKIRLLAKMGQDFGKAYQIRDDILDFLGDEEHLKKPPSDLAQGTITLPMIFFIKMIKAIDIEEVYLGEEEGKYGKLGNNRPISMSHLLHLKNEAVKKAVDYCNHLLIRSTKRLDIFPPCEIKQKMLETLEKMHIIT
ncbi:MAG TPA: polyprenyl synthetase family protein [Thermoanaerobacterales bacterium]|nr:polyprenyl synthetase family protein [Thermoanaerobacterales bacterium]